MSKIEFPVTIGGMKFLEAKAIEPHGIGARCGDLVSVRPCGEKYAGKTYLGIYIGDVALSVRAFMHKDSDNLNFGFSMHNPAMFVPELKEIIYGCGSWWSKIENEDQLRQITDGDIDNVWYVKALRSIETGEIGTK